MAIIEKYMKTETMADGTLYVEYEKIDTDNFKHWTHRCSYSKDAMGNYPDISHEHDHVQSIAKVVWGDDTQQDIAETEEDKPKFSFKYLFKKKDNV